VEVEAEKDEWMFMSRHHNAEMIMMIIIDLKKNLEAISRKHSIVALMLNHTCRRL
jgi:hypothetical protein